MTIENYPLDPDEENPLAWFKDYKEPDNLIIFRSEAWEQEQWNRTHFLTGRMMETPVQPLVYHPSRGFSWKTFWTYYAWSLVIAFVLAVLLFALAL